MSAALTGATGDPSYGSSTVDAIAPSRLRTIVRDAIEQHIDPDQLALTEAVEASERNVLAAMIGGVR